jgi:hypothetical protein
MPTMPDTRVAKLNKITRTFKEIVYDLLFAGLDLIS